MMLGDLLAELDDEAVATETLLATDDLALVARVRERAEAEASPLGSFIVEQVGHFGAWASSDDWMSVMSAASRSDVPGVACLRTILTLSLAHQKREATHDRASLPA